MGKTAIITGGSKGIGLHLCLQLRDLGWDVFTCGRSAQPDSLTGVSYKQLDLTDRNAVNEWLATVDSVDLLVNNAAVLGERTTLVESDPIRWVETFDVNVHAVFYVLQATIPKLAPASVVVNISSSVGRAGRATWGAYSASKCALEGMTDILSQELEGTTVFSANPGGTATEMRADAFPDEDPETLPTASEIAGVIVGWILSPGDLDGAKLNCRDALPDQ